MRLSLKYILAITGSISAFAAIMTFIKAREELIMNREKHSLDKELAELQIASLKNKNNGIKPSAQTNYF